ncbi:uncharacterized protein LOC119578030 [Penaeus monodon]|uniref:uncharacterized protein LOC119578030 n=1 Tax=Penaeus monodon TaxID=6687 RepID=UPI0018A70553|nr:uncharacterized protein LOC119578030 [Penaeus monodon]
MMKKHREEEELHMFFMGLGKAYDRMPRQEAWRCMRGKGVAEKYVRLVQDVYEGAKTRVRGSVGVRGWITVRLGLHQGFSLNPYLINLIMEVLSEDVKDRATWCMLLVNDIVICSNNRGEIERKLEYWRRDLEDRGLKVRKEDRIFKFL